MPPKSRITRDMTVDAAAEIVRWDGAESVNARTVARELGCSTAGHVPLCHDRGAEARRLHAGGSASYRVSDELYRGAGPAAELGCSRRDHRMDGRLLPLSAAGRDAGDQPARRAEDIGPGGGRFPSAQLWNGGRKKHKENGVTAEVTPFFRSFDEIRRSGSPRSMRRDPCAGISGAQRPGASVKRSTRSRK